MLERDAVARPGHLSFTSVRDETPGQGADGPSVHHEGGAPGAPLWLQVGLGRYLQKYRIHYRGNFWLACFGSPVFDEPVWPGMAAGLTDSGRVRQGSTGDGRRVTIPVGELLEADWYEYDGRHRRWYEYTAYAMVHYLIHGENGFNRTRFPLLLDAFRAGKDSAEALALAYPHVLPEEWDERLTATCAPPLRGRSSPPLRRSAQGLCFQIPPAHHADKKPRREKADMHDIQVLMADLQQVDPFRRHSGWWPQDIVDAEASKRKRPAIPGGEAPVAEPRSARDRARARATRRARPAAHAPGTEPRSPRPPPDDDTPTIRVPLPPPP